MARSRLNLAGFRLRFRGSGQGGGAADGHRLSRRDLLRAAGATAIASAAVGPALQHLGSVLTGEVEVTEHRGRISVLIGGVERWSNDPGRFGGSPRTMVEREEGLVRLRLDQAFFPGTTLPADLVGEIRRDRSGWRIHLQLLRGAFAAEVPLHTWLSGSAPARARVRLEGLATRLGDSGPVPAPGPGQLILSGKAKAAFGPDWSLSLAGPGVARLTPARPAQGALHRAHLPVGDARTCRRRQCISKAEGQRRAGLPRSVLVLLRGR